jgi:phosphatidylglycerophosphate synthase
MKVKGRIAGYMYQNKQAAIGILIGVFVSLIFHLHGIGAFLVGVFLTTCGVVLDYLDGGDRDV